MLKSISLSDCRLQVLDQGAGTTLLLVHGFPLNQTMWREQVAAFSKTHHVIAPDLRGFGQSTGAGETLTMSGLADDLAALLDALKIREPVTFCGLSMGGYVAFEFWRRHRPRLAKLVLCDTRAIADTPEGAKGRLELAAKVMKEGAQVVAEVMLPKLISAETLSRRPAVAEELRQVMLATQPATIAAALRGLAQRADFTASLPQIDLPTLVVCGEHDAISAPQEMQGLAAAMPHARYVEIAGVGHMSPLEAPAEFNAALAEWLQS